MVSLINTALGAFGGALTDYAGRLGLEYQRQDAAQAAQDRLFQQQTNLEQMRNDAQTRAAILADELAGKRAAATAALTDTLTTKRELALEAARAQSQRELEAYKAGLPTPDERLLNALGVPTRGGAALTGTASPSGGSAAPSGTTDSGPYIDNGTWDGGAAPPPEARTTAATGGTTTATSDTAGSLGISKSDIAQNFIRNKFHIPPPGSEEANRRSIATGVDRDMPDATPDERAKEVERRFQVATGKMPSADEIESMAQSIAKYDMSPLDARARMGIAGPAVMARAKEINPNWTETKYDTVKETQKAIVPGGNLFLPISAMETSLGHASHFLDLATQISNSSGGTWANTIPNRLMSATGMAPLVRALDQTAFAMAEEGNKIYAGNAGTQNAIMHWYETFPRDGSLSDQIAAVRNFTQLMGDKFNSIKGAVDRVFQDSGVPKATLLSPEAQKTYERLSTLKLPNADRRASEETIFGDNPPASSRSSSSPKPSDEPMITVPPWVKPGDQYSPSRGLARAADGTLYGAPR